MGLNLKGAVHLILHSTDASAGANLDAYWQGGTVALQAADWAGRRFVITDITLISANAGEVVVSFGSNGNGLTIFRGVLAAGGGVVKNIINRFGPIGVLPKIVAPAGVVDIQMNGYLV